MRKTKEDLQALIRSADEYKEKIQKSRPLSAKQSRDLIEYFRIGSTYASNAIEGNTLTLSETKVILEEGITIGGKSLREHMEAIGHAKAYDYMMGIASGTKILIITEEIIKEMHRLFYYSINEEEAGLYRRENVIITGTDFVPPKWEKVASEMSTFIEKLNSQRNDTHPIEWAARLHLNLVSIHPFIDGNGRTARLLMNLALVHSGYGVAVIPPVLRSDYMSSLRIAQSEHDEIPFYCLIAEAVLETQRDYCRLLHIN